MVLWESVVVGISESSSRPDHSCLRWSESPGCLRQPPLEGFFLGAKPTVAGGTELELRGHLWGDGGSLSDRRENSITDPPTSLHLHCRLPLKLPHVLWPDCFPIQVLTLWAPEGLPPCHEACFADGPHSLLLKLTLLLCLQFPAHSSLPA